MISIRLSVALLVALVAETVISSMAPVYNRYDKIVEDEIGIRLEHDHCDVDRTYTLAACCGQFPTVGFMATMEKYLRTQSSLLDKSTRCEEPKDHDDIVDAVVVGSGAGSVVARHLAEAGFRVMVLEAGPTAPVGTQVPGTSWNYVGNKFVDWNFKTEPQKNGCLQSGGVCTYPRGKMVGGSYELNGMMYMRGYPEDYKQFNTSGWTYEEVMEYFLRMEDNLDIGTHADEGYHGQGGDLTVSRFRDVPEISKSILEAAAALGYPTGNDMNGKVRHGFTIAQAMNRNGERLSPSRAYLYDIENPTQHGRLRVRTNALVTRIIFNENNEAVGVEYQKNGNTYFIRALKEVIISAGAIKSPHLLLLSGIGPKEQLKKHGISVIHDLPGVGLNLKNHASCGLQFQVHQDKFLNLLNFDTLKQFLLHREGPLTSTGMSQFTGFVHSKFAKDIPDLQMFFSGFSAICSQTGAVNETANVWGQSLTISPTLLSPKASGSIELGSSDPTDPPKINANILGSDHDLDVILDGIRIAQNLTTTAPLKTLLTLKKLSQPWCDSYEYDSDDYWKCYIEHKTNPENHQVGTCKMGPSSDPMAVVDERLRVRGVKKLRVIDASVLPIPLSGNIGAPILMAAEKGSQMIIEDHQQTYDY